MPKNLIIIAVVLVVIGGLWFVLSGSGVPGNTTPAGTPSPAGGSAPQGKVYPPSASGHGKVIFAVKDAVTGSMQEVTSVLLTIDKLEVHSASQGWITVSTAQKQYDLLKLKQSGSAALLADANLPSDTYDQIRLNIRTVEVRAGSMMQEAKLPSHTLKLIGNVVVKEGEVSTATIDFIADKSLHLTGNGTFILSPVVKLETRSSTDIEIKADESVVINGGRVDAQRESGMDEKGEMRANFELKGDLDLGSDNIIRIKSGTEVQNLIRLKY